MSTENYVYKKEIDWSVLSEGITLPRTHQVVFGQILDRMMVKGENKPVHIVLNGKTYDAEIRNVNFNKKFDKAHKNDILQLRYKRNGELAQELQKCFISSYNYIKNIRETREPGDRSMIKLPENMKEYLAIYTTEYDDTYLFETIEADTIGILKQATKGMSERQFEADFSFEDDILIEKQKSQEKDENAKIVLMERLVKVRKLNRKIGDNLKKLYNYRCQICGENIGMQYGCEHVVEAHHIDYFVKSLNNDMENQIIICPNHHSIIHDVNPVFDRRKKLYLYENGYKEGLKINKHL